ncbi:hypothetical protein NTGM5_220061 [Candidatus Nitrotoga sp. M5]|nr:hypothetical protein NTGM5_220061 [Candidatus Nitrotoga sp. M5]
MIVFSLWRWPARCCSHSARCHARELSVGYEPTALARSLLAFRTGLGLMEKQKIF